ncbi:Histidinol-phosphate aminotransferase [Gossypium arboreum]|uniref:Histidinol-phosphate aminotransferase n=1 Tax=Gossypium arboreum TaxID=29729 RepID=A0A0B0MUM9_GOSAR|nr:Histidinol-phosphate aminotransferase [Gossypium arboreum]
MLHTAQHKGVWPKSVYPTNLARPSTWPGTRACEAISKVHGLAHGRMAWLCDPSQ